jgi:hypothetical protein
MVQGLGAEAGRLSLIQLLLLGMGATVVMDLGLRLAA